MMQRAVAILLSVAALTSGCGLAADPVDIDGTWILQSGIRGGAPIRPIADAPVTLVIGGSETGGVAACNHYGGTLDREGSAITFSALSMTEMGCDPRTSGLEAAYLAALAAVDRFTLAGGRLTLNGPDLELQFAFDAPDADAPLALTPWTLESVVSGDAVASVLGNGSILFADDGTLTGSTGCRGFGGAYELDGTRLLVSDLVTDDRACADDLARQDTHVLEVLGAEPELSIDGLRLSMRAGDRGLDYRTGD